MNVRSFTVFACALVAFATVPSAGATAAGCDTTPPSWLPVPAVAVCVTGASAASGGTCYIYTSETLDPINGSQDVYISYTGSTYCQYTNGTPMPMARLENITQPQNCRIVHPDDPTSITACQYQQGNYGSNELQPALEIHAQNNAIRCYDCKGDLIVTETLHRLTLIEGRFAPYGSAATCTFNTALNFAECETSDYGTTTRDS